MVSFNCVHINQWPQKHILDIKKRRKENASLNILWTDHIYFVRAMCYRVFLYFCIVYGLFFNVMSKHIFKA